MRFDSYETLEVERRGPVVVVHFARPDRMNAFDQEVATELDQVFKVADAADECRAIVVTGQGRAFCAGQNLAGSGHAFEDAVEIAYELRREQERLRCWEMNTPVIAAINGHAVGIGLTMTLQWDFRIAARDAKYAFPFVRRGLPPDALSGWLLPRLVGQAKATEWMLTGRFVDADELHRFGLLTDVVDSDDVLDRAVEFGTMLAEHVSPTAAAITKRIVQGTTWNTTLAEYEWDVERPILTWMSKRADAAEGPRAFLEKRSPRWTDSANDIPTEHL